MSLLLRKKPDWFHSLSVKEPVTELLRHRDQKLENVFVSKYQQSHFEKVKSFLSQWYIYVREVKKPEIKFASILHDVDVQTLAARQRARYLRLVEPPNSRELKCVRGQMKKQTLLHKTARSYYVISLNSYFFSYNLLHLTLKMTPFIQQGFDVSSNHAVDSSVRDLWKVWQWLQVPFESSYQISFHKVKTRHS